MISIVLAALAIQVAAADHRPALNSPPAIALKVMADLPRDIYPAQALRDGKQGYSIVEVSIDPDGKAYQCAIAFSSGTEELDRRACDVLTLRPHYKPAEDMNGKPIAQIYRQPFAWLLPNQPEVPKPSSRADLSVDVQSLPNNRREASVVIARVEDVNGQEEECWVAATSEINALDKLACGLAKGHRLVATPALDRSGAPMRAMRYYRIRFFSQVAGTPG